MEQLKDLSSTTLLVGAAVAGAAVAATAVYAVCGMRELLLVGDILHVGCYWDAAMTNRD